MTQIKKDGSQFYIPELDGLRFVAFFLVFIHNAQPILSSSFLKKISEYGWIGVDMFFCLSAYLLTKILLTEHENTHNINSRNFYIRRILRIFPPYFFYIFIVFLFRDTFPSGDIKIAENLLGLTTFTYNFVYFDLSPSPILLFIHLWSISCEFQYYMILPWLGKKFSTISDKQKTISLLILFLVGSVIRAIFILLNFKHPAIYILPITHFDSVVGGIAIGAGLFDNSIRRIAGWNLLILGIVFNAGIFLLPNNNVTGWNLMLTYPMVGIGMSLIVLAITKEDIPFVSGFLKRQVVVFLGKISYGLYIFHIASFLITSRILMGSFGFTADQLSVYYPIVLIIAFSLTCIAAIISNHVIERPFLKMKDRYSV